MRGVSRNLIFVLGSMAAPFVSAQTVVNGDFENVAIGTPYLSSSASAVPGWTRSGSPGDGLLVRVGYSDPDGSVTVAGHGSQFVILGGGQRRSCRNWRPPCARYRRGNHSRRS